MMEQDLGPRPEMDLNASIKEFEKRQIIFSVLGLLIIFGLSIVANNLHLQSVATQTTRHISRKVQTEEFRDVALTLAEALIDNFKSISYESSRASRSFMLPASKMLNNKVGLWEALLTERVSIPVINPLDPESSDRITFEYERFRMFPYGLAIWILLLLVSIPQTRLMKKRLVKQFDKELSWQASKAQEQIAAEVRHNLRTPLAALSRIPGRLPASHQGEIDLLQTSIEQIRQITAKLNRKDRGSDGPQSSSTPIYDVLVRATNQVAISLPSTIHFESHIDDSLVSSIVGVIPFELQVIIGNIVTNSLEAYAGKAGVIKIRAVDRAPELIIEIEDRGPGIDPKVIDNIFNSGFTNGKTGGTGLGLFHARTWITKWGGRISAISNPGAETIVRITLPIRDREPWYVPRLKFGGSNSIIVLDDQASGIKLWEHRFQEHELKDQVEYYSTANAISRRLEGGLAPSTQLFFDYDIGDKLTGLDLLLSVPHIKNRFLVTGHFDKIEIREACKKFGISLIPKSEVAELPIVVVNK